MNKENTIFLLGGKDLEMSEIKKVLLQNGFKEGVNLFDKNLSWGAKLSSYKDILEQNKNKTIYGIELIEDIIPPKNYTQIDHHNENSDKPSSLFQVLDLLNIKPNREQELISANDIGHIEAMKCIGATKEEVEKIREQDRKMQGVTQEEELQAQEEIKNIKEENGLYILKTNLQHFSPIVDRFNKRPLLIYSDNSLTYYGNIDFLKDTFKQELEENKAYSGKAFFGFDSSFIKQKGADILAKEILKVYEQNNRLYSHHYFMFPFRFDYIKEPINNKYEYYRNVSFEDRVKIDKYFYESLKKDGWEYKQFEINTHLDYNEYVYFYDFVKDSLFNQSDFNKNATSYYFDKKVKDKELIVQIKDKTYKLDLIEISLRVFETGIAILSFEVENRKYYKTEDILKINDFTRRVYPQFLGNNFEISPTKNSFLPTKIKLNGIEEKFDDKYTEIKLAKYITQTLGNTFTTNKSNINRYLIQPIIDDRMFVISWYGNDAFSECVKQNINYDNWYKYVFVDGGYLTVQDEDMQKELIKKSTYTRWKNYGTFYGITRYSFVCLTQSLETLKKNNADFIIDHIKTMYFQMVTLLLAQRASLIRFSDEITAISDIKEENEKLTKNISKLYKNYIKFVNKLYFKEITPQEQGIELYEKAQNIMNITRDMQELQNEATTIKDYAFFQEEYKERKEMNKLTQLGTLFLPGTFIAGIFGMNVFPKIFTEGWIIMLISIILMATITIFLIYANDIKIKELISIKSFKNNCLKSKKELICKYITKFITK